MADEQSTSAAAPDRSRQKRSLQDLLVILVGLLLAGIPIAVGSMRLEGGEMNRQRLALAPLVQPSVPDALHALRAAPVLNRLERPMDEGGDAAWPGQPGTKGIGRTAGAE